MAYFIVLEQLAIVFKQRNRFRTIGYYFSNKECNMEIGDQSIFCKFAEELFLALSPLVIRTL